MSAHLQTSNTLRVLVVEDEPRLRELLVDIIEDFGFEATSARSAEEARKVFESSPPHILMLDLQLPGMSGMDFLEALRQKHRQTQVIILTGFGDLQAAQKAIRLDVVDFLGKPFHMADIEQALARARQRIGRPMPVEQDLAPPASTPTTLAEIEREQILAALKRNNGNRTKTAQELEISRRTLHYRLDEYRKQGFEV